MRTVKIEKLSYPAFEGIRDALAATIPFALVGAPMYSKGLMTGFFYFWDGDYIPPCLRKYTMSPVSSDLLDRVEAAVRFSNLP